LRALVKHLDGLTEQQVVDLDIPTGVPRVYELADDFRPRSSRYLGDPKEVERRAAAVRDQAARQR
jgi:2,3-bisphosphoglycerate-dependent phosphoglycerate mutase